VSQPPLLVLEGVTKRFGGLTAVADVSFTVPVGESWHHRRTAPARPRCSRDLGYYRADSGRVVFAGQDVVGQPRTRSAGWA